MLLDKLSHAPAPFLGSCRADQCAPADFGDLGASTLLEQLVKALRDPASAGVHSRDVRRKQQDAFGSRTNTALRLGDRSIDKLLDTRAGNGRCGFGEPGHGGGGRETGVRGQGTGDRG